VSMIYTFAETVAICAMEAGAPAFSVGFTLLFQVTICQLICYVVRFSSHLAWKKMCTNY